MQLAKKSAEEQLAELSVGVDEIIAKDELYLKLQNSLKNQKPLLAKLGADPSRPDIHLGHTVVLNKLRLLQELGHRVVFIIGDFTAMIGDPTGQNKTRPEISHQQVNENAKSYTEQVFKILDQDRTEVVKNSEWLNKLDPMDFVKLLACKTVQQLIAREDFSKRWSDQTPIFLHEIVYPILQGYDSCVLNADIELGGTDQRFNLLLGRELQKVRGQSPQSLILMPLLEGLDGVQKMSKSLGNYVALNDPPKEMFGKLMSVSDSLMIRFYELLSSRGFKALNELKDSLNIGSYHPMAAKKDLAAELVSYYWGEEKARQARAHFEQIFSKKETPIDLAEKIIKISNIQEINLVNVAVEMNFCKSKSEARRILKQKGLRINGQIIQDERILAEPGKEMVFKFGKFKIVKLVFTS